LGCLARLPNLEALQAKARAANHRLLEAERAGQGTVLASPALSVRGPALSRLPALVADLSLFPHRCPGTRSAGPGSRSAPRRTNALEAGPGDPTMARGGSRVQVGSGHGHTFCWMAG